LKNDYDEKITGETFGEKFPRDSLKEGVSRKWMQIILKKFI